MRFVAGEWKLAIPIEERSGRELTEYGGKQLTPKGVSTFNPAFDVTPADLVTAIITERGVAYPPYTESLRALKTKRLPTDYSSK